MQINNVNKNANKRVNNTVNKNVIKLQLLLRFKRYLPYKTLLY